MPKITRRTLLQGATAGLSSVAIANTMVNSGAWASTEPEMKAKKQLLKNATIAVIGAGAFGSWTALKLTELGANVKIIDPWGAGNSRSSSGGESRVIRSIYGADRIYTSWVRRSLDLWKELEKSTRQQVYHETGVLWMFSVDDQYMQTSIPVAKEFGFEVDELPLQQGKQRFPQINFEGVKTLFFEHTAGSLLARKACHLVTELAQSRGAAAISASVQRPGEITNNLTEIHLSNGKKITADHFVFACGPWLGQLFPELIGELVKPTRQEIHYFGYPSNQGLNQEKDLPIWVDFGERIFYGIPETERRGFKIADDTRGEVINPTTMQRLPTTESIQRSRDFLAQRFPTLANAPLVESRVCQYENSSDGNLIIDQHPSAKNVWIVGGGSGHGFKLSPAVGEFVANRIAGSVPHNPFFGLSRFQDQQKAKTQFE